MEINIPITDEDIYQTLVGSVTHKAEGDRFDTFRRNQVDFLKDPSTKKEFELDANLNGRIVLQGMQYGVPHSEVVYVESADIKGGSHTKGVRRLNLYLGKDHTLGHSVVIKIGASAPLEQIEEAILRNLNGHSPYMGQSQVPAVFHRKGSVIGLEDLVSRKIQSKTDKTELEILPLNDVLRKFHLDDSHFYGDHISAQDLVVAVLKSYEKMLPAIAKAFRETQIDDKGKKISALGYMQSESLAKLAQSLAGISQADLSKFFNYYELLAQHKKSPYFAADLKTLAGLFLPVKKLDDLNRGNGEIAKDINEGNVFVAYEPFRKRTLARTYPSDPKDIMHIDFEGGRFINTSFWHSVYWLLFYPGVINPDVDNGHDNLFTIGDARQIFEKYIQGGTQLKGEKHAEWEKFQYTTLKESLKHASYFGAANDIRKARYFHEIAIVLTDAMKKDTEDINPLNKFLRSEYAVRYGDEFDGKFTVRFDFDPYGNHVKEKFKTVPPIPVKILAASSYRGPERPALDRIASTI